MSEEEPEELGLADLISTHVRPWNGYWTWKDKPVAERGAACDILEAAGIVAEGLVSREPGEDPPDCEATIDGCLTGVEVTELVHQPTLQRSLKALKQRADGKEPDPKKSEAHFIWDFESLSLALQDRIDAKDRSKLKGGPYQRYILVIHTDEMFLESERVGDWLQQADFEANRITDVLFALAYEPRLGRCPVFRLTISRRAT